MPHLLEAIQNRVVNWQFREIFDKSDAAKHFAAKKFVEGSYGVTVKANGFGSFVVLSWKAKDFKKSV